MIAGVQQSSPATSFEHRSSQAKNHLSTRFLVPDGNVQLIGYLLYPKLNFIERVYIENVTAGLE